MVKFSKSMVRSASNPPKFRIRQIVGDKILYENDHDIGIHMLATTLTKWAWHAMKKDHMHVATHTTITFGIRRGAVFTAASFLRDYVLQMFHNLAEISYQQYTLPSTLRSTAPLILRHSL